MTKEELKALKCEVTVEQVYGNLPIIPNDYEVEAFRTLRTGDDEYLTIYGDIATEGTYGTTNYPRLILRKKPKKSVLTFREVRRVKYGEVIRGGEWYRSNVGSEMVQVGETITASGPRIIYELTESEE
jgi:hypothetical protein